MKRAPASGNDAAVTPRVRRGYFESRFGQLHVHNAMPPGGGFDEATALLCLHASAQSGRAFHRFLEIMGRDRSTYAPDIPGFGESDPPPARPSVADYAAGIGDFVDSMRFRRIDVLGYHFGAAVAAELAVVKPQQIRRAVLIGVPLLSDAERDAVRRAPAPGAAAEDGSHLVAEWRRILESRGPGVSLEALSSRLADRLYHSTSSSSAANALVQYGLRDRLASIAQPVMVLRPRDELWDATLRAREALPRARMVDLPDYGHAVLDAAPQVVADAVRDFLRA